jgi:hypothetical protein
MTEKIRDRTCPLCEQYIPNEVEQFEIKIGGNPRGVHVSCAKLIAEAFMNKMLSAAKREKRKKRKKQKRLETQNEAL